MKTPSGSPSCTLSVWSNGGWPILPLFPPRRRNVFHEALLEEILRERVASSRSSINLRGVRLWFILKSAAMRRGGSRAPP